MNKYSSRKGLILAGGKGTRLYPLTLSTSKQLLPVYDKPMIFYPLSTLMLAGIKEFLVITAPEHINSFKSLLGNGDQLGISIEYEIQPKPEGIAQAFLLAETFLDGSPVALILGDNLFHGNDLISLLKTADEKKSGATIFAYPVSDPMRYGVVNLTKEGSPISIEEKPKNPKSRYAVTGLYFYDESVVDKAKKLVPSSRGEIEISTINQMYLKNGELNVEIMGRGMAWLDTGTFDSLQEAGEYIKALENRQGLKIGSPEEIAWRKGWITDEDLSNIARLYDKSGYGKDLLDILKR
jgi:glucose-1-phosphate thymidylyltransferase